MLQKADSKTCDVAGGNLQCKRGSVNSDDAIRPIRSPWAALLQRRRVGKRQVGGHRLGPMAPVSVRMIQAVRQANGAVIGSSRPLIPLPHFLFHHIICLSVLLLCALKLY